ncbi:type IA DNA topoisomerase (plasmid) [Acinetobacter sp. SK-43]|uniref:type IA DNA topoisomerase n=1 Tax=Acinetobacter sp. SK-43 TaxID=2785295 RepID=UPI00188B1D42|nr:type IA DNA topoisomerase [Acinetobacter sp. SK-43]MBF4454042.1 type IA DNA topoisomerase [Acinetobacter sp. SK-43]
MQKHLPLPEYGKMQQTILFVVEKPDVAAQLASIVRAKFSDAKIYALSTLSVIGTFEFDYPRGLKFRDIPYLQEPKWKYPSNRDFRPVQEILADRIIRLDLSPKDVLSVANKIILATDLDPANVFGFHLMISEFLGHERAQDEYEAIVTYSMTPEILQRAVDNPLSTKDDWYQKLLNKGTAKKYFDFNYNTNSLIVFGELLRGLGVDTNQFIMSKYSLQVLYDLNIRGPVHRNNYYSLMGQWIGSGKYALAQIGSHASRNAILEGLIENNLLSEDDQLNINITQTGSMFLKLLHPDCQDADLPLRMEAWINDWDTSRGKIERYLNTYFSKQKRFYFKTFPPQDETHYGSKNLTKALEEVHKDIPPFKAGSANK